jgi:hypothetical protein
MQATTIEFPVIVECVNGETRKMVNAKIKNMIITVSK